MNVDLYSVLVNSFIYSHKVHHAVDIWQDEVVATLMCPHEMVFCGIPPKNVQFHYCHSWQIPVYTFVSNYKLTNRTEIFSTWNGYTYNMSTFFFFSVIFILSCPKCKLVPIGIQVVFVQKKKGAKFSQWEFRLFFFQGKKTAMGMCYPAKIMPNINGILPGHFLLPWVLSHVYTCSTWDLIFDLIQRTRFSVNHPDH